METCPTSCWTSANQVINIPQSFEKVSTVIPWCFLQFSTFCLSFIFDFAVFFSVHSCNSYLQLCLVGATCPLGFSAMEKQQDYEFGFILLYGDRLLVWVFHGDLHSSSGKTSIFYYRITGLAIYNIKYPFFIPYSNVRTFFSYWTCVINLDNYLEFWFWDNETLADTPCWCDNKCTLMNGWKVIFPRIMNTFRALTVSFNFAFKWAMYSLLHSCFLH